MRKLFIHLSLWISVFFVLGIRGKGFYADFRLLTPLLMALTAVFYFNYFLIAPKFILKGKIATGIIVNTIIILMIISITSAAALPLLPPPGHGEEFRQHHPPGHRPPRHPGPVFPLFILLGISAVSACSVQTYRTLSRERLRLQALEIQQKNQELTYLKQQINPHFLFNALNNIYSILQRDTETAGASIIDLSRMLRYLLYETESERVALIHELNFLQHYTALMNLKLPENQRAEFLFPEAGDNLRIAPLLLLPLAENAFKHGYAEYGEPVFKFTVRIQNNILYAECVNKVKPAGPENTTSYAPSGTGLNNLRKRLELLYPGNHRFSADATDNLYTACLEIPLE